MKSSVEQQLRMPYLLSLADALDGDAAAGKFLMVELALLLQNGIPRDAAKLLASMLLDVANGTDANVALHVQQRGAPRNQARDIWIAGRVSELRKDYASAEQTYRAVAKELKAWPDERITAKRVKNIYLRWQDVTDEGLVRARLRQKIMEVAAKKHGKNNQKLAQ